MRAYHEIAVADCQGSLEALSSQPIASEIASDAIRFYKKGIFNNPRCGNHQNLGVTIVGYGTEGSQDYWIVRNHWGLLWGEHGYIRLARNGGESEYGMCGVCISNTYPVV